MKFLMALGKLLLCSGWWILREVKMNAVPVLQAGKAVVHVHWIRTGMLSLTRLRSVQETEVCLLTQMLLKVVKIGSTRCPVT